MLDDTYATFGEVPYIGSQQGAIGIVARVGALSGIMVGVPLLMLLSTSRFIAELRDTVSLAPILN